MKIIKLSAIDSTNSFLKELSKETSLDNFTVVTTSYQENGKGQQGSNWVSEPGKNLLCSVFVRLNEVFASDQPFLNYAVSLAVYEVLVSYKLPNIQIKWPNDILSSNKKICGILIENTLQKGSITSSIIGIGINVNQLVFSDELDNVCSMKQLLAVPIDLEKLLLKIIDALKKQLSSIGGDSRDTLKKNYLKVLYRKDIPSMFRNNSDGLLFLGMLVGVSDTGKLQIQLEDESICEFDVKAISFA